MLFFPPLPSTAHSAFGSRLLLNVFLLFSRLLRKNVRRIITGRVKDGGGGGGGGGKEKSGAACIPVSAQPDIYRRVWWKKGPHDTVGTGV